MHPPGHPSRTRAATGALPDGTVGEVAEAVIGATGQNPRKGVSHSWQDVQSELCDVIVTAMVALTTLTPEPGRVFDDHLAKVARRSLGGD
ncbi:MazG-like family protein [Streptomyces sp. NPDC001691]|uniref:MazG-like family protein n=1 Tax=Streptomyces sp. NPDC001691 TaxID=3364600 RepID=UPI0036BBEAC9